MAGGVEREVEPPHLADEPVQRLGDLLAVAADEAALLAWIRKFKLSAPASTATCVAPGRALT